jgi:hypothetical protein
LTASMAELDASVETHRCSHWRIAAQVGMAWSNARVYLSFERFFSELGFGVPSAGGGGSSSKARPSISGGSKVSVERVRFQNALPRESCSTLPLGELSWRLKFGRRIFVVSTMLHAPYAAIRCSPESKTRNTDDPPTWSQCRTPPAPFSCWIAGAVRTASLIERSPRRSCSPGIAAGLAVLHLPAG